MDDLEHKVVGRIALGEEGGRQQRRILSWWVENVKDIELMDEVAEDVNKVASSTRTNSDEKEGEEVFPEQRKVHSPGGGRRQVDTDMGACLYGPI